MFIDSGAEEAIVNAGKSLLPSGIVRIEVILELAVLSA